MKEIWSPFILPSLIVRVPPGEVSEPATIWSMGSFDLKTWVGLAILAVFQYFLSMVIFLNVLTRLDATQAALSNYLIPFFGVLLAAVVLGERLTWYMVAGGMLVLLSTVIATVLDRSSSGAQ